MCGFGLVTCCMLLVWVIGLLYYATFTTIWFLFGFRVLFEVLEFALWVFQLYVDVMFV